LYLACHYVGHDRLRVRFPGEKLLRAFAHAIGFLDGGLSLLNLPIRFIAQLLGLC
jgi:hypothetical protein